MVALTIAARAQSIIFAAQAGHSPSRSPYSDPRRNSAFSESIARPAYTPFVASEHECSVAYGPLPTKLLRELSAQKIEIRLDLGRALKLRLEISLDRFDLLGNRGEHPERCPCAGRANWSRSSLGTAYAARPARAPRAPLATSFGALSHGANIPVTTARSLANAARLGWWRRWESNPRPEILSRRRLRR